MAWMHPAAIEHRRRRFTRPSPEELRLEHPELYERKYGSLLDRASRSAPPSKLDIIRSDESLRLRVLSLLRAAQVQVAMLRHELAVRRKANFNPDQPRVPAGNPDGGQWTGDETSPGRSDPRIITDAPPGEQIGARYASRRLSSRTVLINGQVHILTPGQAATLESLQARSDATIARIRQVEPNWMPTPSVYRTPDGLIATVRAEA
jgi:hypothetical protein